MRIKYILLLIIPLIIALPCYSAGEESVTHQLYVANKTADSVSVIDLMQKKVIKTIQLGKNTQPWGIALR